VGASASRSRDAAAAVRVSTTTPVPGWYPDPGNASSLRWWDGAQWSPYTSSPPVPDDPKDDTLFWMVPVGRAWQAVVAGYLGLFVLVIWPLGPVAFGFGAWALQVMDRDHTYGRGRAWFGVITGILSTFAMFIVLIR
jgi:hypothetical protein